MPLLRTVARASLPAFLAVLAGCGRPSTPAVDAASVAYPAVTPPPGRATTLPSPALTITADSVLFDGTRVADSRELVALGSVQRIDALFERAKAVHGDGSPHVLSVEVLENAPSLAAMSAIMTAAFAGLREMRFGSVQARYAMRDPSPEAIEARVVVHVRRGALDVAWQSRAPCDRVPADATVSGADPGGAFAFAPIEDAHLLVSVDAPFADVTRALGAVAAHASPGLTFSLSRAGAVDTPARQCGEAVVRGTNGRLPAADIQKIVRTHFDSFRECYETGLARDAKLAGKVVVKFIIDTGGHVSHATIENGTTIPDTQVRECVRAGYERLAFPKPDGGEVTVVYPIVFNVGD